MLSVISPGCCGTVRTGGALGSGYVWYGPANAVATGVKLIDMGVVVGECWLETRFRGMLSALVAFTCTNADGGMLSALVAFARTNADGGVVWASAIGGSEGRKDRGSRVPEC